MLIEVTEKEAREIYSQRYLDEKGGNKFLLLKILPILLVAFVVAILIIKNGNEWLGYVSLIVLAVPALYLRIRLLRNSGKYARKQIEEANNV